MCKITLPIINNVTLRLYNVMLISCYPIVFTGTNTQTNLEYAPHRHTYACIATGSSAQYTFMLNTYLHFHIRHMHSMYEGHISLCSAYILQLKSHDHMLAVHHIHQVQLHTYLACTLCNLWTKLLLMFWMRQRRQVSQCN